MFSKGNRFKRPIYDIQRSAFLSKRLIANQKISMMKILFRQRALPEEEFIRDDWPIELD
jgi:hypothetical protein